MRNGTVVVRFLVHEPTPRLTCLKNKYVHLNFPTQTVYDILYLLIDSFNRQSDVYAYCVAEKGVVIVCAIMTDGTLETKMATHDNLQTTVCGVYIRAS